MSSVSRDRGVPSPPRMIALSQNQVTVPQREEWGLDNNLETHEPPCRPCALDSSLRRTAIGHLADVPGLVDLHNTTSVDLASSICLTRLPTPGSPDCLKHPNVHAVRSTTAPTVEMTIARDRVCASRRQPSLNLRYYDTGRRGRGSRHDDLTYKMRSRADPGSVPTLEASGPTVLELKSEEERRPVKKPGACRSRTLVPVRCQLLHLDI